jgi:hypothetical protein
VKYSMFRTIIALVLTLVIAVVIGAFQILNLTIADITTIANDPNLTQALTDQGAVFFGQLLLPYTFASGGAYGPLVALGVAGFIAGLVSKSGVRMLFVSLIALGIFFVGYAVISQGAALEANALIALGRSIWIDLGVAFGLLFIPGIIGASLTSEEY